MYNLIKVTDVVLGEVHIRASSIEAILPGKEGTRIIGGWEENVWCVKESVKEVFEKMLEALRWEGKR